MAGPDARRLDPEQHQTLIPEPLNESVATVPGQSVDVGGEWAVAGQVAARAPRPDHEQVLDVLVREECHSGWVARIEEEPPRAEEQARSFR